MAKDELKRILELYLGKVRLDRSEISIDELSKLCDGLSGADIKSIVNDALVKAFHRAAKEDKSLLIYYNQKQSENLINQIELKREDLITSIESVKQTVNFNERNKLKLM